MRLQAAPQIRHAHRLIAQTAEEMAQAVYEECAKDNTWYAEHLDRRAFVREVAPTLISQARSTLGEALASHALDDDAKAVIFQALQDDLAIPRGGRSVPA